MVTCNDPAHQWFERAPIPYLSALLTAAVELDRAADNMRGDLTEDERVLLDRFRSALRRVTGQ